MVLNNGIRLLGSKTVDLMTINHIADELLPIAVTSESQILGSLGEFEWSGIYNTFFWIDPTEDLVLIQMTQYSPHGYYPINNEFKVLVYQAIVD
jgi:CubicO group peptidase (beta-lactamase class C family)